MTTRVEPGQLAVLGLKPGSLGEVESISWPEAHVGLGRGKAAAQAGVAALILSQYANQTFAEIGSVIAARQGVRVRHLPDNPQVLMISAPSDSRPIIRSITEAESAVAHDRDDPDTVLVDLGATGPAALLMDDGRGLLLTLVPGGIDIREILPQPIEHEPFPALDAPLSEWCADCGDPWLVALIRSRTAHADSWNEGVAVGLYAPLLETTIGSRPQERHADQDILRPRTWARALSQPQSEGLEHLARAEIDRLLAAVAEVGRRAACDDRAWAGELLDLCVSRDDLEGVHLLLSARRSAGRLGGPLEALDHAGRELMATLPLRISLGDERLRRVWLADPDVWWVQPYAWSRKTD